MSGGTPKPAEEAARRVTAVGLDELAHEVFILYGERFRAEPTRDKIRQALGQFRALPGVETTADLTPINVARLVRKMMDRGVSRETIKEVLAKLSTACSFAVRRGWLETDPVKCLKHWMPQAYEGTRTNDGEHAAPTEEEVSRLLTQLLDQSTTWEGHRLFALVAVVVYAGLRKAEALKLHVEDCDIEGERIRVADRSWVNRVRPMPRKLAEILREWLPSSGTKWAFPGQRRRGPWIGGNPTQRASACIRAAGEAAGIAGLTFEKMRAFWEAEGTVVVLPDFEAMTNPERRYKGPRPKRPGPKRIAVQLGRPEDPPKVLGRYKRRLRPAAYKVIHALLAAGADGLSHAEMQRICGDAVGVLKRLAESDDDWADVVRMPGVSGRPGRPEAGAGRYRIVTP